MPSRGLGDPNGRGATRVLETDGVFSAREPVRMRDITDGTSKTATFSETVLGGGPVMGHTLTDENRADVMVMLWSPPLTEQRCNTLGSPASTFRGARWADGFPRYLAYYHWLVPNSEIADCAVAAPLRAMWKAAGSRHPNGINVLMCYRSVRFVANGIDLELWHAMATINGNEYSE